MYVTFCFYINKKTYNKLTTIIVIIINLRYYTCMETTLRTVLKQAGLEDKEIKIYLMLLHLGTSHASTLGEKTGMARTTAQFICQQLVKKNLAGRIKKKNAYVFFPENPQKLLFQVRTQMDVLEQTEHQLERFMGQLRAMMNPDTALPKVRFYEGEKEMIHLYEQVLEKKLPIDSLEETGELFTLFPEYPHEFVRKRIENGSFNRCIAPAGNPLNVTNPDKLIEVRMLNKALYPFTWHIKITGDLVGIFSFQKPMPIAIGIEHKDIAKNFRLVFEFMWHTLA
jgi:predicted transcriptional regulator